MKKNKNIKILLISIIVFLAILCISSISFAWSPSMQSPLNPQGDYYCREKGGALRFTTVSSYYLERGRSTDGSLAYECPCEECRDGWKHTDYQGVLDYCYGGNDVLQNLWDQLAAQSRPIPLGSSVFGDEYDYDDRGFKLNWQYYGGDNWYGPYVALTPTYNSAGTANRINDTVSYIFSAYCKTHIKPTEPPYSFKKGNYEESMSDKASNSDIQNALWADSTYNTGRILAPNALYNEAVEYKLFNETYIANGYMNYVKFDDSNAQVIVKRTEKKYIVGPYKITYPQNDKFAYIENIFVTTDTTGNQEIKPRIIMQANGTKPYPASGQEFFLEFDAAATNYPTKAKVNVKFAYLEQTIANYELLEGRGEIKQYRQHLDVTGDSSHTGENHSVQIGSMEVWNNGLLVGSDPIYGNHEHTDTAYVLYISLDHAGDYHAQRYGHYLNATRVWRCDQTSTKVSKELDLTMELGGYVWEDAEGGKESISNGRADSGEARIPNVPVTLYKQDGTQVGSTKTDGNGQYKFEKLNALFKYYVKFTYNGQYYQPTTYASSSTWGSGEWQTNSNATDIRNQRLEFNVKFESIGSSPENYVGQNGPNKSYTREELRNAGAIDDFGNLAGGGNESMRRYVRDCLIDAYTGKGDGTCDLYPVPDVFVIDTFQYPSALTPKAEPLYPNAYYINLGLDAREESDLAIKKDVDHVTLEINGQKHTYTYDTLENKDNAENEWDINVRLSDAYYNTNYSRELYKEDYIYKASMYGNRAAELGKTEKDELEVYVTYKIMVRNQSLSIRCKVNELVDYYDQDLEYVEDRSYIQIKQSRENGAQAGKYNVYASDNSLYSNNTRTNISGYDNLYITGLGKLSSNSNENYLEAGQTAYIYLTFKVKKEAKDGEKWVILDEDIKTAVANGVGKENIVEINGYSTQYAKGTEVPNVGDVSFTPAGIVDRDSNPGNLNPSDVPKDGKINYDKFEDDTDKAPNIRIILYRDDDSIREISGNVWEDIRDVINNTDKTAIADGIQDNNEPLINGVTVQLVELMDNGQEYVWREFGDNAIKKIGEEIGGNATIGKGTGTGLETEETPIINAYDLISNYRGLTKGEYVFKSFMPGKYVVRFIYGDKIYTALPSSLGGENEKSYNGQDYKSTNYQEGFETNKTYTWRERSKWEEGQEILGNTIRNISSYNKTRCNQNDTFEYLYDITASAPEEFDNISDAKDIKKASRDLVVDYSDDNVTNYIAEVLASHKDDYYNFFKQEGTLQNKLQDLMYNTQIKAETGVMVIEVEYDRTDTTNQLLNNKTTYKIKHVNLGLEERPEAQLTIDKKVTNVKLTLANGSILFDAKQTADNVLWRQHKTYEVDYNQNMISGIRNNDKTKVGLVQLSMDEELMHGATIEISYLITVRNEGEVDYKDNSFYYIGKKSANAPIVTTSPTQVMDYVANNLQFNSNANNGNWYVVSQNDIFNQDLVNARFKDNVEEYNTIIVTDKLGVALKPSQVSTSESEISIPLVLTQLITSENDTDDLTYKNITEIVKTANSVGRRMEYSVVGNQNPAEEPNEVDSDQAEVVKILPPFGNGGKEVIVASIVLASAAIITVGIIFIKKKVLIK